MNEKKNHTLLVQAHQLVILVLLVFSLFVKEDVKKVFWLIIGSAVLSLLIQSVVYGARPGSYSGRHK